MRIAPTMVSASQPRLLARRQRLPQNILRRRAQLAAVREGVPPGRLEPGRRIVGNGRKLLDIAAQQAADISEPRHRLPGRFRQFVELRVQCILHRIDAQPRLIGNQVNIGRLPLQRMFDVVKPLTRRRCRTLDILRARLKMVAGLLQQARRLVRSVAQRNEAFVENDAEAVQFFEIAVGDLSEI